MHVCVGDFVLIIFSHSEQVVGSHKGRLKIIVYEPSRDKSREEKCERQLQIRC